MLALKHIDLRVRSTGLNDVCTNIFILESFMISKCFVLVRVTVEPEPVLGTLGRGCAYSPLDRMSSAGEHEHTFMYTCTLCSFCLHRVTGLWKIGALDIQVVQNNIYNVVYDG